MNSKKMIEGNPLKLIIWFSLPLMLGNIFQQLYTVVDTMIVGKILGVSSLAAVGSADWISWMAFGVITAFPQGFSILIAQAYGANDEKEVNKHLVSLVQCSILVAVVFTAVGYLGLMPLLKLLNTPSEILLESYAYVRVIYLGLPITMFYNACASVLRAFGDSKTPLRAMVLAAIMNIGLDFIFILYFKMGVSGAALATVIAQGFAAIYCFMLLRRNPIIMSPFSIRSVDWVDNKKMFEIGFPMAFQNLLIAIGGIVLTGIINGYGTLFIAGFTAVNKMYGLLEIAAVSYGYAMVTYVGQNYGAHKYVRIKEGVKSAAILGFVTAVIITIFIQLFDKQILLLFLSGEPHEVEIALSVGEKYLLGMSLPLFVLYLLHVYRSALQGLSNTFIPMVSGFVELACRLLCATCLPLFLQENGLYFVEPSAWVGATILLVFWYYKTEREILNEDQ